MEQEKLEKEIEDIELYDKSETEIERVVSAFSKDGMKLRRARKDVRYKLYRLKSEAEGKTSTEGIVDEEFKQIFEKDPHFGGWRFFGITWDVSFDDPYRCVHRDKSVTDEWDELVAAKFPTVSPGGKVSYPDINVRKAVEKESKLQNKLKDNEE